jgi:DNA-directed RNA polymerase specialized sigma24 family protein
LRDHKLGDKIGARGGYPEEGGLGELIGSGTSDQIARALQPQVRRVVARTLFGDSDPDLLATATSDALLAICRYRSGFRRESKVSTWVHTIARRAARRCAVRERSRRSRIFLLAPESLERVAEDLTTEPQVRGAAEARIVLEALVPNESWRRIWLLANDPDLDLTREEVARRTGYTPASIGVILSRVRGRLNGVSPRQGDGL